jgi:hypothetical protein
MQTNLGNVHRGMGHTLNPDGNHRPTPTLGGRTTHTLGGHTTPTLGGEGPDIFQGRRRSKMVIAAAAVILEMDGVRSKWWSSLHKIFTVHSKNLCNQIRHMHVDLRQLNHA